MIGGMQPTSPHPAPEPATPAQATAPDWLHPHFDDADDVLAWMTTRQGGASSAPWLSMNLGTHVGDDPRQVGENRQRLSATLGLPVLFLDQVHGVQVHAARREDLARPAPVADAAWTADRGLGLAVQVADCLPVLFSLSSRSSSVPPAVAAAHAGWRGLCAGVIEATLAALCRGTGGAASEVQVWLGPCIGPRHFEVGTEVRDAFLQMQSAADAAFVPAQRPGKWLADLHLLARLRLQALGVHRVSAQPDCTFTQASRYFSFRRDGRTGRMAAVIGLRA